MPPYLLVAGLFTAIVMSLTWICIARGRLFALEDHVTRTEYPKQFWFAVVSRAIAGAIAVWLILTLRWPSL